MEATQLTEAAVDEVSIGQDRHLSSHAFPPPSYTDSHENLFMHGNATDSISFKCIKLYVTTIVHIH